VLLRQGKAQASHTKEGRQAVAPMVTSKWSQGAPYNLLTPKIDGVHAPTGCMPTAMAQILYYWKSKAGASAMEAYTTDTKGIRMEALPATTFDYDIMQDEYEKNDSSDAAYAVAKLMLYCGQAFEADYDLDGSGASGGTPNFIDNFHFDIHGFDLESIMESREQWDEALYNEMAAGRPIFMSGVDYVVGHGFVVDGYDPRGFYHINWGWYGNYDGFYLMDVACPGDTEDETIYGEGYSIGQIAGIGLRPESDDITYDDMALSVSSIETDAESYSRGSVDDDFSVFVTSQVNNYYGATLPFEHSVAVFSPEGTLLKVGNVLDYTLRPMYGGKWGRSIEFGSGMESGNYILKMVSRMTGQETWNEDFGSYRHYVELTVDGNTMTAVAVTNPFTKSFTINSMEVVGVPKVGREATLRFNATNTGTYYINALYIAIDGKLESAIGVPFAPGETGDFFIRYTPSTPGDKTIQIRTSRYNTATTFWNGNFDVAMPSEPNLTVETVTVKGADEENGELSDDMWCLQFDVKNEAAETYDGVFRTLLYRYNTETGYYNMQEAVLSDTVIPAGETACVEVSFPDTELEIGATYFSQIRVYEPSSSGYVNLARSPYYKIVEKSTGIASPSAELKRSPGDVFNISGQRVTDADHAGDLPAGFYIIGGKKFLQR
ncbi:MAG: C10 family peptidase, partial [Bacteroidaceae bacterium]|nr:C10 family peptidase [Bacteroidaceae bacterium]